MLNRNHPAFCRAPAQLYKKMLNALGCLQQELIKLGAACSDQSLLNMGQDKYL